MKDKLREIENFILKSKNILLVTHKNPDGDALGSMLALKLGLAKLGLKASAFCQDSIPETFRFLPDVESVQKMVNLSDYDLIIALDYGDIERTGLDLAQISCPLISIDHHLEGNHLGQLQLVLPNLSSTAEIIYYFFEEIKLPLDKEIATCLLTGIFTDTGSFQHVNTSIDSLKITGQLLKKGARLNKITKHYFQSPSLTTLKIWSRVLSKIKKSDSGMVYSQVSREDLDECKASPVDLRGFSSLISTAADSRFALLLTEYEKGKIDGSLRSEEYKGVDVSKIAKVLGGGGHKLSSGFKTEGSLKEVLEKVKKAASSQRLGY